MGGSPFFEDVGYLGNPLVSLVAPRATVAPRRVPHAWRERVTRVFQRSLAVALEPHRSARLIQVAKWL